MAKCRIICKTYIFISIVWFPHIIVLFSDFSALCTVVLSQRLKEDMQFFHKSSHSSSKLQAHCLSVCLCSALLWQYVVRCKNKDIMGSCVDVWYFSQTTRLHGRKCSLVVDSKHYNSKRICIALAWYLIWKIYIFLTYFLRIWTVCGWSNTNYTSSTKYLSTK